MPRYLVFLLGVVTGLGAAALAPYLQRNGRPLLKEAIKTAIILGREAQIRSLELVELIEDVYAEAKAEAAAAAEASAAVARAAARRDSVAPAAKRARKRATARKASAKRAVRTVAPAGGPHHPHA